MVLFVCILLTGCGGLIPDSGINKNATHSMSTSENIQDTRVTEVQSDSDAQSETSQDTPPNNARTNPPDYPPAVKGER